MADQIEQAFGRYNVAVTMGRDALPSANAYSALLDERKMAVVKAILHHHPDVVRLVLAARRDHGRPCIPITDNDRRGCNLHLTWWDGDGPTCGYDPIQAALDPFKEVQE